MGMCSAYFHPIPADVPIPAVPAPASVDPFAAADQALLNQQQQSVVPAQENLLPAAIPAAPSLPMTPATVPAAAAVPAAPVGDPFAAADQALLNQQQETVPAVVPATAVPPEVNAAPMGNSFAAAEQALLNQQQEPAPAAPSLPMTPSAVPAAAEIPAAPVGDPFAAADQALLNQQQELAPAVNPAASSIPLASPLSNPDTSLPIAGVPPDVNAAEVEKLVQGELQKERLSPLVSSPIASAPPAAEQQLAQEANPALVPAAAVLPAATAAAAAALPAGITPPLSPVGATTCTGFSIGTTLNGADVVQNGTTQPAFTVGASASMLNTIGSETHETNFYFNKTGPAVTAKLVLEYTTPSGENLMKPEVSGALSKGVAESQPVAIGDTPQDLSVVYNCADIGGTSVVWLRIIIDGQSASTSCGNGGQPVEITVLWTKYCRRQLDTRTGLNVGLTRNGSEAMNNGVVQAEFAPGTKMLVIPERASVTTFYLRTIDGTNQVFGPPRLEVDETKMIASVSGAADGGIMTGVNQEIYVHYLCGQAKSEVTVTMTIDICAPETSPAACDITQNFGYEPISVQWMKTCSESEVDFLVHDFVVLCVGLLTVTCIFRCCFNFTVLGKRGSDVLPMNNSFGGVFSKATSGFSLPEASFESISRSTVLPTTHSRSMRSDSVDPVTLSLNMAEMRKKDDFLGRGQAVGSSSYQIVNGEDDEEDTDF
eukprot:g2581.t1